MPWRRRYPASSNPPSSSGPAGARRSRRARARRPAAERDARAGGRAAPARPASSAAEAAHADGDAERELAPARPGRSPRRARGLPGRSRPRAGSGRAPSRRTLPHQRPARASAAARSGAAGSPRRGTAASAERAGRDRESCLGPRGGGGRARGPRRARRRGGAAAERSRGASARAHGARPHRSTSGRSCSRRAGPMPGTASSSSTDRNAPFAVAVVEDLLRGHRPDSRELVELLECRRVQMDLARRRPPRPEAPPAPRPPRRSRRRDDHLLAVGDGRGEVDEVERRLRPRAPRLRDRVVDPAALREAIEARPRDRPGDVDDDLPYGRLLGLQAQRGPVSARRSPADRVWALPRAKRPARTRTASRTTTYASARPREMLGMRMSPMVASKCARVARGTCRKRVGDVPIRLVDDAGAGRDRAERALGRAQHEVDRDGVAAVAVARAAEDHRDHPAARGRRPAPRSRPAGRRRAAARPRAGACRRPYASGREDRPRRAGGPRRRGQRAVVRIAEEGDRPRESSSRVSVVERPASRPGTRTSAMSFVAST